MTTHPHEEQLSAYLDGMLDIRQMRQVAQHLGACVRCRAAQTSLLQTKLALQDLTAPATPGAEFWADAYRRMRTEGETRPVRGTSIRDTLASSLPGTQRRWAAGVAAAGVIGLAVAGPLIGPSNGTRHPSPVTVSTDSVDISSLVRAHTESAARQPLADADRQTMINADTDGGAGFNDVAAEFTGDGGSFAADAAR